MTYSINTCCTFKNEMVINELLIGKNLIYILLYYLPLITVNSVFYKKKN